MVKTISQRKIKWGWDMSDADFVAASLPYFQEKYFNLHIGCCLLAGINPQSKSIPVGQNHLKWAEYTGPNDYTMRPFTVAMRCIKGEQPILNTHHINEPIKNGKDVILDVRVFVAWAIKKWPNGCSHFEAAEKAYQERKNKNPAANYLSHKKTKAQIRNEKQSQAFFELYKEPGNKKLSNRKLAGKLEQKIKDTYFEASLETLRKRIPEWKGQIGSLG